MALSTEQPIFVCGLPKSGTTLVGQLLSNHPDIAIDYDIEAILHFLWYAKHTQEDFWFFAEPEHSIIDRSNEFWRANDWREWHLLNIDYFQKMHQGFRNGFPHWGNSTCFIYRHQDIIWSWFPRAKFAVVRRDPRDHWCSFKELYTPQHPDKWEWFVKNHRKLPPEGNDPRSITIEYHEAVRNPESVFESLGFLAPEHYLNGTMEVYLARSHGSSRDERRLAVQNRNTSLVQSRVGRWKRELPPDEVRRCYETFPELCAYYDKG